ncbi:D-alanyl-D-alanine carboxypeptidase [Anaerotignum lactatifermentans]|uniref:serine-type D-Ala-D-Ala carboxypeptidase n=1 Tax=Anaerotignum lactatifermentans TaxID=160404 RepID=A0ABS2G902_9FIRM|nr:D-alanyl-D-alanine carboxypeptidase family protein [Anaerotignum lactatifermentans]MBM6828539.1 D-alanyl-D-alanine carboxypeptidase [Anaerotignum lactatifermentans]MBM6877946.1 D-alanyl-D-alanine carboxypeptidase [Anaerotignum lactatifermentans]MBM6950121.1 D-alanyl-D-alanine carboxypeptidase [Anaerotignum lactatifermentans]
MKHKIFALLMTCVMAFSFCCTAFAESVTNETETVSTNDTVSNDTSSDDVQDTDLTLTAASAILIDATTGRILYEKNAYEKQYPASITKLMTILLALENGTLTDEVTFSHEAVYSIEQGSAHIAIQEGEVLTLEQVLYGIILRSANECANAAGEFVDGSLEAFAQHMTERAKELGCQNTNFVNANGLFDENHYTTAYDMALIAQALLKNDTYRSMMSNTYYEIPPTNKQTETRYLYGQHQMLNPNSLYYYEYAEGGKTGYTVEAQNTLVTYAKKNDTELIAVVLKCSGAQHYVDTKALFDYGFANYKTAKILSAGEISQNVEITETYHDKTEVKKTISAVLSQDVYATLPIDADVSQVQQEIHCDTTKEVPVTAGDALGTVTLTLNGETIGTAELTAETNVAATTDEERAEASAQTRNKILKIIGAVAGGLILVFLILLGICRYIGHRRRMKRRARRKAERKKRLSRHDSFPR